MAQLTYSQYYFDTERKAFKFYRKKTRGRSKNGGKVIIPITKPLQYILDDIAALPKLNALVFPHILEGATHERDIRKRVSGENSNVQDRLIKICKDVLHWEVRPTSTWARHSFATNLNSTGIVPDRYISDSMGHSSSGDITSKYIGAYPLKKMLEYNAYLLNEIEEGDNKEVNAVDKKGELLELLKSMSEEERAALMAEASK